MCRVREVSTTQKHFQSLGDLSHTFPCLVEVVLLGGLVVHLPTVPG